MMLASSDRLRRSSRRWRVPSRGPSPARRGHYPFQRLALLVVRLKCADMFEGGAGRLGENQSRPLPRVGGNPPSAGVGSGFGP